MRGASGLLTPPPSENAVAVQQRVANRVQGERRRLKMETQGDAWSAIAAFHVLDGALASSNDDGPGREYR